MVDWIGKFSLLLKRVKDPWMDLFPLIAITEQQRESQYQADMTQFNNERRGRSAAAVDPSQQATRDQWHATQGTNHERPFPFSDNLTTLMCIAVSDLSEAQRERLTSSLSLQGMNVTVYTLEAVKTVFLELFCSPKSSMENPSLRVSRHGGSTSRTFIVEDYVEDEHGQWGADELVNEVILMMKDRVFGYGTTTSILGNPHPSKVVK